MQIELYRNCQNCGFKEDALNLKNWGQCRRCFKLDAEQDEKHDRWLELKAQMNEENDNDNISRNES